MLALIGYSTTSGEVFAGPLDLGRAEIGPLRALGSLGSLTAAGSPACAKAGPSYRFIADMALIVRVTTRNGRELFEASTPALALLAGASDRLCVEGLEMRLPKGREGDLTVAFGPRGASASLRGSDTTGRLTCSLEPPGARCASAAWASSSP